MRRRLNADLARRAGLLAALALASAAPAAAAPVPVGAVWGPSTQIVFGALGGGIYVVSPDGGRPRKLTARGGDEGLLSISPGGKTLLFGDDNHLYTVPIAGGGVRRIGAGYNGVWSPDGKRIAFTAPGGIFRMDADGRHARKVATNRYTASTGAPTWSPDGRKLAYVACSAPYLSTPCEHSYGFDVYVIGVDGSDRHRVTPKSGFPQCPAWSRVAKLAFLATDRTVALVQAGGGLRTFRPGGCPVWAPGGRRFAVPTRTGISLMNADGSGRKRITIQPRSVYGFNSVAWSPDGARLAVVSGGKAAHLYVVRADGTGLRRLA